MLTTYYGNETIAALFRISIPSVHCAMFGNLHNTVQRVNNLYGLLITEKNQDHTVQTHFHSIIYNGLNATCASRTLSHVLLVQTLGDNCHRYNCLTSKQGLVIPLTGDIDCFTEQAHCSVDHLLRSEKLEASYLHSNQGMNT